MSNETTPARLSEAHVEQIASMAEAVQAYQHVERGEHVEQEANA